VKANLAEPVGELPPQNLDAEERVLGALLSAGALGPEPGGATVRKVQETGLQASDFYRTSHGVIWKAIVSVDAQGKPIDPVSVVAELQKTGRLERADGAVRVHELAVLSPAYANAPSHARLVIEKAHLRKQLQLGLTLQRSAHNGGLTPEDRAQLVDLLETRPTEAGQADWLESAADLLVEPDPGPTPFLIEELIVDQAIAMMLGSWKVGKTWVLLEFAVSIVTGRPAFDRYEVANPGPVIVVLEESGRAALHRRLDALRRGYALETDALADLHFAANRRVRLNDEGWKARLLAAGRVLEPRAILLDPFVRLKGAEVDENIQREVGPVLDFMRDLRDESGAMVMFVHHTGHNDRDHGRGSSDFEGYWESKVSIAADEDVRTLKAEHREAEAAEELRYRLDFDETTRSLRLAAVKSKTEEKVEAYLREHSDASANKVYGTLGGNRQGVLRAVREARGAGGSEEPEPARTSPRGASLASGSEEGDTPRRGVPPGTTADGLVPADENQELQDEANRLAQRHADIGGGSA
jgi:hypothetical protein